MAANLTDPPAISCRRAKTMQLDKYMMVGKSVLSNRGLSDPMIAEMFEAVISYLFCFPLQVYQQEYVPHSFCVV